MRGVFEQPRVAEAVNDAFERWTRAEDAWEVVKSVIARDAIGAGETITESGKTRAFTYDGARSIDMPSIRVIYEVDEHDVTIHEVEFYESPYRQSGRA